MRIGTVISALLLLLGLVYSVLTTGMSGVVAATRGLAGMPRPIAAGAVRVGRGVARVVMIGMTRLSVLVTMVRLRMGMLGGRRRALAHGLEQVGQRIRCSRHGRYIEYVDQMK